MARGPPHRSSRAPATTPIARLPPPRLQRIEADAGKSFDAQKAAFEMKARELYTLDRDKYVTPEEVRISDIAVSIKQRGDEAALARAREARQRIDAGADFAAVAREYSDDPTTRDKGGALPFVTAKALTPDYAKAVFALKTIGAVSEPIKAPSAYHVVRLEERRPPRPQTFEEVGDSIMRDLRTRYVTEQREAADPGDPGRFGTSGKPGRGRLAGESHRSGKDEDAASLEIQGFGFEVILRIAIRA